MTESAIQRWCLEKFELLARSRWCFLFLAIEKLDVAKLLVRNSQDANIPIFWQCCFDALDMDIHVLAAGTMTDIDRELKHRKAITLQILSELGSSLAFFLGVCRQVKENENPHNSILAYS